MLCNISDVSSRWHQVQETDRCKISHCLECCPVISEAGNSVGDKGFQNNPSERDLLKMVAHLKTGGGTWLQPEGVFSWFPWDEQQECPCKMLDQKLNSTSYMAIKRCQAQDITSISLWMVATMVIDDWNRRKSPHDKLLYLASDCCWELLNKFYVARNLEVGKLEGKDHNDDNDDEDD